MSVMWQSESYGQTRESRDVAVVVGCSDGAIGQIRRLERDSHRIGSQQSWAGQCTSVASP
jgi:hypothetical protein